MSQADKVYNMPRLHFWTFLQP